MAVRKRKDLPGEPWVAEFKDAETGKRRQVKPATGLKKDAQKIYDEAMRALEEKRRNPHGTKMTVARLSDKFMVEQGERVKTGEIGQVHCNHLRSFLQMHILPVVGDRMLDELTPRDVEDCYKLMLRKGLHPTSAKKRIRLLRLLETFARKNHWTTSRVLTDACTDIRAEGFKPVRRFTLDEIKHLLIVAETRPQRCELRGFKILRCAVHLGTFCGLRIGEVQALTLDALDVPNRILRVRHNLTRLDELKATKTKNGIRDVPLPEHLVAMLSEWIDLHYLDNPRRLIFTTQEARSIAYMHFHLHSWRPLLCRAGLASPDDHQWRHFHALRHLYSAVMLKQGVAMTDVSALMGHATTAITMQHYAHSLADENKHHGAIEGVALKLLPQRNASATQAGATDMRLGRLSPCD